MKLITKIQDMLEGQFKQPVFTEAGNTSVNAGHWHKHSIDISGNGKTIEVRPFGEFEDHTHEIVNNVALPIETDGHSHKVEA